MVLIQPLNTGRGLEGGRDSCGYLLATLATGPSAIVGRMGPMAFGSTV